MKFDAEAHLHVTPKEVQALAFSDPALLINRVLLPGTPIALPTHEAHCGLLDDLSSRLNVHPRNLLFKGSTKIGFSIAPRAEKVWRVFGPSSDLDLAIVDASFFARVDDQVRQWEREPRNRQLMFQSQSKVASAYRCRVNQKGRFECYRFFDLPRIAMLRELNDHLMRVRTEDYCGAPRRLTAFIFRDWWGVFQRYEHDLDELRIGLRFGQPRWPEGEESPRQAIELEL